MIKVGYRFKTKNCGIAEVIEYVNAKDVIVKFADTGFESSFHSSHVRSGCIKDLLKKSVLGVGFIGVGKYSRRVKTDHKDAYSRWRSMLTRCYCEKYLNTRPTYKGCKVCDEWHNFQNFAEWFYRNIPDNYHLYDIDKDTVKDGNKVYCPEFCKFSTKADNANGGASYHYEFISPYGVVVEVDNLSAFCKEEGLNCSHMHSVSSGKRKSHKGWVAK